MLRLTIFQLATYLIEKIKPGLNDNSMVSKLIAKLSPWERWGTAAKNQNRFYDKDGWCRNFEVFKKYWRKFPKASFVLHIRNYNQFFNEKKKNMVGTIILRVPGIGWNRLYFHNPDLRELFPENLVKFLEEAEYNNKGTTSAKFLVKIGDIIARETGREFHICHQEGGDPEYAEYTEYGPYHTDKFANFEFTKKSTWGFLSLENGDFEECDMFGNE